MKQLFSFLMVVILTITPVFIKAQWNQTDKIVASDRQPGDLFSGQGGCGSRVVSVFGDLAVVGAPNDGDSVLIQSGSAYIYRKNNNCEWNQVQKITANAPHSVDHFGWAVSMYDDFIVVGAPGNDYDEFESTSSYLSGSGAAYVFRNIAGTWVQVQKLTAPGLDRESMAAFGYDVDITRRRLIVGSWGDDGDIMLPTLSDAGAAYVFDNTGTWSFGQKLVASDRASGDWFGCSVAISNDYAIVGAQTEDNDAAGTIGSFLSGSGSAYIFEKASAWTQVQKVTSSDRGPDEYFGHSVDIDGNYAIVGAWADSSDQYAFAPIQYAGSAFIFKRNLSGAWPQDAKIDASDRAYSDLFGRSVSINSQGVAAVGAPGESDGTTIISAGAAYVFSNALGSWTEIQKLVSSDRASNDNFGRTICVNGVIIVGAHLEDEDDAVVPGNTMLNAGSAYVYQYNSNPADEPVVSASSLNFCPGSSVQLTITGGNLNDANTWQWYTGSCGGTIIGTGPSIVVSPGSTTTYYVNGVGNCVSPGICGSITLNQVNPGWHQTTKNALGRDINKDVVTDSDGNVYVTGYFIKQTTLEGGTIAADKVMVASSSPVLASYIAKYNSCGELIWEAHSTESGNNQSHGIVLDALHNRVCITGIFSSNLTFTSSSCAGTALALSTTNTKGFIAAFDKNTGCIVYVNPVAIGVLTTYCEAITINETTGDLYVGGDYSSISTSAPSSFIAKYNYFPTGIGSPASALMATAPSNAANRINDMDYRESSNTLWAIGDFRKDVQFPGVPTLITAAAGAGNTDAFLLKCSDIGAAPLNVNFALKGECSTNMTGEGITVDDATNIPYITGSYKAAPPFSANAFQQAGLGLIYPAGSGDKAYMMRFAPGSCWARTGIVAGSNAYGKSVSVRNGRVYFVGTYMKAALSLTGFSPLGYVSTLPVLTGLHTYVAIYNTLPGAAISRNATADLSNDASHEAESVYTGTDGKCYVVGSYYGKLDDYAFTSTYGTLISTGLVGHRNAFALRVDGISAAFREEITGAEEYETGAAVGIHIYPNPSEGTFTVDLKNKTQRGNTFYEVTS
ncbi:MAG: FG-GAP repeat protein, partial [Bacteroidia bacterium]|nr:FG-GAP repeat protein [Bacteroidia bacterium]